LLLVHGGKVTVEISKQSKSATKPLYVNGTFNAAVMLFSLTAWTDHSVTLASYLAFTNSSSVAPANTPKAAVSNLVGLYFPVAMCAASFAAFLRKQNAAVPFELPTFIRRTGQVLMF
jgi:hypothetical protein